MEEIIIQVKDKNKVQWLTNLLQALDFVTSVRVQHKEKDQHTTSKQRAKADFFAFAGLWQGRDVTIDELRQKAWPRQ
jgi:hypothetical protein